MNRQRRRFARPLFADTYSVAASGILVPADSAIRSPADLAGIPLDVRNPRVFRATRSAAIVMVAPAA